MTVTVWKQFLNFEQWVNRPNPNVRHGSHEICFYASDSQSGAYAPPVGPGENLVGWEIF